MPARSGRLEKRMRLAVPVEIFSPQNPAEAERTTTENVCSFGIRILTLQAKDSNERLMISSRVGDALARVVYCERLADGRFGVGLQFQGHTIKWPTSSLGGAAA